MRVFKVHNPFAKGAAMAVFFLMVVLVLPAQEKQGMAASNYLSTSVLQLNPSATADSWVYMQANLLSAGAFASSNVVYLPGFSAWSLPSGQIPEPEFKNPGAREYLLVSGSVEGPGFVLSKGLYGFGFFTRLRSQGIIKGIPYETIDILEAELSEENRASNPPISMQEASGVNMVWAEYGFNAAKLYTKNRQVWQFGLNLKYLTGINVQYKYVNSLEAVYIDSGYQVIRLKAIDRYNDAAWASGRGVSADLGLTYKYMSERVDRYYPNSPRSNCRHEAYKLKLALSLTDLGALRFRNSTYVAEIDTETVAEKLQQSYAEEWSSYYQLNRPLWALTPAALVMQADYNFENSLFLSALLVKNLVPDALTGARASNLLVLSPRFERQNIEFALPLSLQRFRYPHLGFAFRFRSFVLGVDNIMPFLKRSNTQHLGLYFKLGWSLFQNPACKVQERRVDDCRPGVKKGGLKKARLTKNETKKRSLKKRILTWF